jgi:predicted RNA-binding Zn ribbon-like protein
VVLDAVPLLGVDATSHGYGGRLCLAVTNSIWWRRGPAPDDHMRSYPELVGLAERSGWVPDAPRLVRAATGQRAQAARVLAEAVSLRESLFEVFSAVAAAAPPAAGHLAVIEARSASGLAALQLDRVASGGFRLRWTGSDLELPLHLISVSATLLLTAPELDRVKQCPGPTCGWVFLDTTRNRSRRWCETSECGNRNRVQAHYRRTRDGVTPPQ